MKYLKPLKSTFAPRRIATVAVNLVEHATADGSKAVRLKYDEGAIAFARRGRKEWSHPLPSTRLDADDLWSDLLECLSVRTQTYILCENVSEWLLCAGIYDRMDRKEITLPGLRWDAVADVVKTQAGTRKRRASLIVGGGTEIVRFKVGDCWAVAVGIGNYVGRSVEQVYADSARKIGGDWPDRVRLKLHRCDAAMRAALLREWATSAADWWRAIDGGPWRETAANLAHSLFRRRHLAGKILKDDHPLQHRMARAALFGGRASQWFYGRIGFRTADEGTGKDRPLPEVYPRLPGPVYHLDCRSLYASLLRDRPFPVQFLRVNTRETLAGLKRAMKLYGVIANVELDTSDPEYPFRRAVGRTGDTPEERDKKRRAGDQWRERTDYPIGRFWTTLAGPELERAIKSKSVKAVHGAAYYRMATAFRSFAMELLDRRRDSRRAGDVLAESFAKLLANSFAGKFAQRAGGWSLAPEWAAVEPWGEWMSVDAETKAVARFRAISGVVQRYVKDDGTPRGIPQIFAFLTAYGRTVMRDLRACCPPRSVISQDTDSLWVLPAGLAALRDAGHVADDVPGKLRVLGEYGTYHGWGPRHYRADDTWVLAGLKAGWERSPDGSYTDQQTFPYSGLDASPRSPDSILSVRRRVLLTGALASDPVEKTGWSRPLWFGRGSDSDPGCETAGSTSPSLFDHVP